MIWITPTECRFDVVGRSLLNDRVAVTAPIRRPIGLRLTAGGWISDRQLLRQAGRQDEHRL